MKTIILQTVDKIVVGIHLDMWSSYDNKKKNIDILSTDRIYSAIADNKCPYYSFKLPIFSTLLLVKDGKEKATEELHNICMDFGRLMQVQVREKQYLLFTNERTFLQTRDCRQLRSQPDGLGADGSNLSIPFKQ